LKCLRRCHLRQQQCLEFVDIVRQISRGMHASSISIVMLMEIDIVDEVMGFDGDH
jgi:hypothetical protein